MFALSLGMKLLVLILAVHPLLAKRDVPEKHLEPDGPHTTAGTNPMNLMVPQARTKGKRAAPVVQRLYSKGALLQQLQASDGGRSKSPTELDKVRGMYREMFNMYDEDGDGLLNKPELVKAVRKHWGWLSQYTQLTEGIKRLAGLEVAERILVGYQKIADQLAEKYGFAAFAVKKDDRGNVIPVMTLDGFAAFMKHEGVDPPPHQCIVGELDVNQQWEELVKYFGLSEPDTFPITAKLAAKALEECLELEDMEGEIKELIEAKGKTTLNLDEFKEWFFSDDE